MVRIPAYLMIAATLRTDIANGRLGPGAKLPSETQLMMRHQVSRSVAKWAVAVLKADGLVDGRQGAGVFVRTPSRIVRDARRRPGQPYEPADTNSADGPVRPDESLTTVAADAMIAQRLAVPPGTLVLQVAHRRWADGTPQELLTSWRLAQPALDRQGLRIDEACERVIVRPANQEEIVALRLPARGVVLVIARTTYSCGTPVETVDIVAPSDRYELVYRLPIH
jgi:DNA-binding GntR family transcriptional regulator